jgi:Tol biopolymer transport system component
LWDLSADGKWAVFSRDDPVFAVQETGTTRATDIVRAPGSNLGRLRISPDDRWMAFNKRSGGSIRLYILPFETTALIPEDRWIPITPEETLVNAPQWSAAGEAIYYFSNRDGHFCVWRQTIDRATGRPTGEPVGVWHVHDARLSMSRMPLPSRGMAVSRDAIVISIAENAGNIWMSR